MKQRFSLGTLLFAILLTAVTAFNIIYVAVYNSFNNRLYALEQRETEFSKLSEIRAYLERYYILDYDNDTLVEGASAGMLEHLPDGWSYYLSAEEYAAFEDTAAGDFVGIGVSAYYDETAGGLRITEVYADSPAQAGGIHFFDVIIGADGVSFDGQTADAMFKAVAGEEGTEVALTIFRPSLNDTVEITVTRATITDRALRYELLDNQIGYIRISEFSDDVDTQFQKAIETLIGEGASAFVFDVRFNPGGQLTVLANMLDYLLPEGTIIRWVDKNGRADSIQSDPSFLNYPMAVIIHEYSISAAEFFSKALQEYESAVVVGSPTTGKCYAQTTFPLSDGSAIALSTIEYTTPFGYNLSETGVLPDIEVSLTMDQLYNFHLLSFDDDPQLQAAMDALLGE